MHTQRRRADGRADAVTLSTHGSLAARCLPPLFSHTLDSVWARPASPWSARPLAACSPAVRT
eukprot:14452045-Alexandrium_andersonii.AAC.1